MTTLISHWEDSGFNFFDTTRGVALTLAFEPDYLDLSLIGGWPAVTFDNSAPLAPATESLIVSLAGTPRGRFEPETGHLVLPVLLRLNFSPDPWFARRDQQVEMTVSTHPEDLPSGRWELTHPWASIHAPVGERGVSQPHCGRGSRVRDHELLCLGRPDLAGSGDHQRHPGPAPTPAPRPDSPRDRSGRA
jgi:hypothetical protein